MSWEKEFDKIIRNYEPPFGIAEYTQLKTFIRTLLEEVIREEAGTRAWDIVSSNRKVMAECAEELKKCGWKKFSPDEITHGYYVEKIDTLIKKLGA